MNDSIKKTPKELPIFTRLDKIGFILLAIGGFGFIYNFAIGESLPVYFTVPNLIIAAMGTFLSLRWFMDEPNTEETK